MLFLVDPRQYQAALDLAQANVEQAQAQLQTIRVRGAFENKDGLLRPGLFAQLRIPSSPKYKAVLISDLAVGYDQGQPIVYVVGADDIGLLNR